MSTFIRSAIFAAAVLAGLSAVKAHDSDDLDDNSKPLSSYDMNNPADVKAFWEQMRRNGS